MTEFRKDHSLNELAEVGNVAQFVSFAPNPVGDPVQTHSRLWEHPPNYCFGSADSALGALLANSSDRSVNLRSFTPGNPRSREFVYGVRDIESALGHLRRLNKEDLFVIVNETIDVKDGGISGVVEGGVIEFAPDDTPRCVEKPGTASFRIDDGLSVLQTVYGFRPELPPHLGQRIEFSIHPIPRGYKRTQTLLWERESVATGDQESNLTWPNRFSRLLGDKVFGLLVANLIGVAVPRSIVISRRLRPFVFGEETGSARTWLRTCPTEQNPGRYTTVNKWVDPFELLAREDPDHDAIASIISQAAVPAYFSGAAITKRDGRLHIEGTAGSGDEFMLGRARPQLLPDHVIRDIHDINQRLRGRLGAVRFEWVHDGNNPWIVQLHKGATTSTSLVIVPGDAAEWITFQSEAGLEALRELLAGLPPDVGVNLEGEVGLTSHLADVARKSRRPTRIIRRRVVSRQQLLFELDA